MADEKITQISPEEVARIRKIYDDRFALEEKWRLERALEEKYDDGLKEAKRNMIHKMLKKMSKEEISVLLDMPINDIENLIK